MPRLEPKTIAALLRQAGLTDPEDLVELTGIALSESGGELAKVVRDSDGTYRRGPWLLNDRRGFDRNRMVTDALYAARCAIQASDGGRLLGIWPTWSSGDWKRFVNAADQAVAQSASVSGSILAEDGTYVPRSFYDEVSPAYAAARSTTGGPGMVRAEDGTYVPMSFYGSPGQPVTAAFEIDKPLQGLRVTGTELSGDFSSVTIGDSSYSAGMGEIPNLTFTLADPQGDMLFRYRNLWVPGARVEYVGLDLRIDEIEFSPGGHGSGQITLTAVDALVYALQRVRGTRVVQNTSPTAFIHSEVSLAGYNPALYYLGEQLPSQTEVARDVPDPDNSGSGETPSAWTTIQRLAKEQGKRAFISGRKLIFGSIRFAADWAAPGDLRIGFHSAPEGARWLGLPSAKQTSVGSKSGVLEVTGRVPLNRAHHFRPGVSVVVHNTPSVTAADRRFVCASVSYTLARDTDGAEITLIEPVELEPEKTT